MKRASFGKAAAARGRAAQLATTTEAARVRRGSAADADPAVLANLASDPSVTVRAALALNRAAPPAVNASLAKDPDGRVRALLAKKLAELVPCLTAPEQAMLLQHTWNLLAHLVQDTLVRVRATIAEAVKDMPQAPRELVLRLARDTEIAVSEPVIRFSPLLTSADLLALLAGVPASAVSVARRARIDATVADAIIASANSAAIRTLIENQSAQIREATLDALVGRAACHTDWHAPLVHRPELSPRSACGLSEIVATHLLEVLAARADLPSALGAELRLRLADRLAAERANAEPPGDLTRDRAMAEARTLAAGGGLSEEALILGAAQGEARFAAALLALASGQPASAVDRAASLRSAKGIVSLLWRAGYTMRAAPALQMLLARLPPEAILHARRGGGFPLTVEEMLWQIGFLNQKGKAPRNARRRASQ